MTDRRLPPAHDPDVQALCDRYDPLLSDPQAPLAPGAEDDLGALARVFDLDAEQPAAQVWRAVRAVLVRQEGRSADAASGVDTPLTLLVVEDDVDIAADLTDGLTEAGHRVVGPFHDAATAEAAAALHVIDLALLDINLSGEGTGVDLARSLKDRWGVGCIFLSGDVTTAARHAELAEGLVTKPYSRREVLAAVRQAAPAI